jgi:uncharacterized membrane protein YccC
MTLTPKIKTSIKIALAMTIAYGIALSMDWDRPYWAGFAVAFTSLSTVGQSLNKGLMRMFGTLLALVMSLFIIALFVEDRWWFMVALSGWLGFCAYRVSVSKRSYFWFLAGFASVVISFDGGFDPVNAFDTAILRAQETGLGVLVYTLVSILLWPTSSRPGFEAATRALVQAQHQLFSGYRALTGRTPEPGMPEQARLVQDTRAIAAQYDQLLAQFGATLDAALTDTYEVWELRRQWHRFQRQSSALRETLERWHESSKEFGELDLDVLLPNLEAAMAEFERRFADIERLFAGEVLQRQLQSIDLSPDHARVEELSPFHEAAFALARTGLQRLDGLTREQFGTVVDIKGLGASAPLPILQSAEPSGSPGSGLLPNPDGMIAAVRAMASLWLAYLLWIYLRVPGGTGIVVMSGSLGLAMATNPRLPPLSILMPVMSTIVFAGTLYVFVMPQLSSFIGLGSMIFLVSFTVAYLFSAPQQGLTRSMIFALFLVTIGVSNEQQYDFLSVADTAVMFLMLIGVLILFSRIPFSMQPDKFFLRLLGRFFHSCEYLLSTMRWDPSMTPTRLDYWRRKYHVRELAALPQKLAAWGKLVDTRVLSDTTPEQLQALTTHLQTLAYRMQELMDARDNYPQAELLVHELLADMRAWRLKVQKVLQVFSRDPAAVPVNELREQLATSIQHLEVRIKETLNKAEEGKFSDQDGENFYRLLGAYRGLSEAMIEYAVTAEGIGWDRWRESRF